MALSGAERLNIANAELLIATHVSYLNDCLYCQTSHGAVASHYLGGARELVEQVKTDYYHAPVSDGRGRLRRNAHNIYKP